MTESKAERLARQKAVVDKAIAPYFTQWITDLRTNGLDRAYPMPPIYEDMMVSSDFGKRSTGKVQGGTATGFHRAIDLVTRVSSQGRDIPIHAVIAGRVLYVGVPSDESGMSVVVGGVDGKIYSYAHLEMDSTNDIKPGDMLDRGDTLGLMGRTGATSGKCVHVVERVLPFAADGNPASTFDTWSWQKSKLSGNAIVPPGEVIRAMDAFKGEHGRSLNFRDLTQTAPHVLWEKDPKKMTAFRGAMTADLNPHSYDGLKMMRDALPKGSPMYMALDATVRAGHKPLDSDATPSKPKAPVALAKALPKKEEESLFASITSSIGSFACTMTGGFIGTCSSAQAATTNGKAR